MAGRGQLLRDYYREVVAVYAGRLERVRSLQESGGASASDVEDAELAYLKAKLDYDLEMLEEGD